VYEITFARIHKVEFISTLRKFAINGIFPDDRVTHVIYTGESANGLDVAEWDNIRKYIRCVHVIVHLRG